MRAACCANDCFSFHPGAPGSKRLFTTARFPKSITWGGNVNGSANSPPPSVSLQDWRTTVSTHPRSFQDFLACFCLFIVLSHLEAMSTISMVSIRGRSHAEIRPWKSLPPSWSPAVLSLGPSHNSPLPVLQHPLMLPFSELQESS